MLRPRPWARRAGKQSWPGPSRFPQVSGTSGPIRQSHRRQAPRRYPPEVYFRRRVVVVLAAALVVAVIVGLVTLGSGNSPKTSTSSTTTTRPHTTTTGTPSSTASGIGIKTVTWTDTNAAAALVVNPAPGGYAKRRSFVTEIWYPSTNKSKTGAVLGAKPDYRAGPYPVIVFAHGFDTLPSTYTALLSAWVRAGFVVVARAFPTRTRTRSALSEAPPPPSSRRQSRM